MPIAPRHPCSGAGPRRGRCPNLVARGISCCVDCLPYLKQQTRRYDVERDQTDQRKFLHSRTWRAVREMKLRRSPLCEECERQGKTTAAQLVHHRDRDETNSASENLLSLCTSCHEEIHKGERWGR
jgi:5-methylcytosine-specific restriction protein A